MPRSLGGAQRLYKITQQEVVNAALRARNRRIKKAKELHKGPPGKLTKKNYDAVKAQRPLPVTRLPKADGTFTANEEEKHAITKEEWMKVFWHYAEGQMPTLEAFMDECGDLFEEHPLTLPPLQGSAFRKRARNKRHGACSTDGWRAEEVAALPVVIFNEYARLFMAIESGGEWPEGYTHAPVALLPKPGMSAAAGGPLKQRPITVFAVMYRLYGSLRYKDLEGWQELWLSPELTGGRKGGETRDLNLHFGLDVEKALVTGVPLHGAALDEDKCFDAQVREVIFGILAKHGGADTNVPFASFLSCRFRLKFQWSKA